MPRPEPEHPGEDLRARRAGSRGRCATTGSRTIESVLVITYTRKAAGELRARIRAALLARGRHDLARDLDGRLDLHHPRVLREAPPGSSVCSRSIDPRSSTSSDDEHGAGLLRGEAFERGARDLLRRRRPGPVAPALATYGATGLRRMLTGLYERLRSAGRPLALELGDLPDPRRALLLRELHAAAQALADDTAATDKQRSVALAALNLEAEPDDLIDLDELRASGARGGAFNEARKRLEQAALDISAIPHKELLQELLELFAADYAAAKERESALDFEDLQLLARNLLRDDARIRRRRAAPGSRSIMGDEFQDTNALQCDVIDFLAAGPPKEVFYVGDEFQSIYGFRHADVQVFRERREHAAQRLPLTENYRSRPEVLAAINYLFADAFGSEFQPLAASGDFPDPVFGHPVELLVTDKASYAGSGEHWRRAEAKHIAARVRELVDAGDTAPGEIVLLFAAGTDAETYEEELRALGLPTYRATGRRYFGQQQVVDLLMYLRLLHNRYDDEALVSVLASPLVGVSNDGLVLVRPRGLAGRGGRSTPASSVRCRTRSPTRTSGSCAPSSSGTSGWIALSASRLARAPVRADRLRARLRPRRAGALGRQAPLREPAQADAAGAFLRGAARPGHRGIRALHPRPGVPRRRSARGRVRGRGSGRGAAADDPRREGPGVQGRGRRGDGVMTTGRVRAPPDEILALADGRFGFKAAHPKTGVPSPVFGYEDVRRAEQEAGEQERLRLYYVAMTRAIDRLIVSGAIDERLADTPIGWVLERLRCEDELRAAEEPFELERGGATFLIRADRGGEAALEEPVAAAEAEPDEAIPEVGQLALFGALPELEATTPAVRGYRLPDLAPIPVPPLHRVRRLSYSALALFERCSYRYYAERVAGLREQAAVPGGAGGLAATEIGDAVHRLLELVDLRDPRLPDIGARADVVPGASATRSSRESRRSSRPIARVRA